MRQPNLLFSSSPHAHSGESVSHVMQSVVWALMPASALAVAVFGWPALLVILITVLASVATEHLVMNLRKRPSSINDWSAALTGLLLALTLPPHTPWWICVAGGVFAIGVAKQVSGGLGYNIFNPALIARVFLLISFPVELTFWPTPAPLFGAGAYAFMDAVNIVFSGQYPVGQAMDALTAATPLGQAQVGTRMGKTLQDVLFGAYHFDYLKAGGGVMGGSLGETSAVLLTLGGLYLLRKRIITWHIPVTMLAGCLVPAAIFWGVDSTRYADPVFHLVTGGLVLGAFFMATDMVTSPVTTRGQLIFGLMCGLLTYIIRTWGGYPEGVSFAIVIMNATVPLLDQYTRPGVFGKAKKKA